MWLNKTSSDVTLLWRTSWRFLRCWLLLLFSSLKLFTFPDYLSLPAALHPGFSDPLRPSPALSFTLATFRCFTFARLFILKWALRFWAGMFHPLMFFTLHSFPTFFGTFVTQVRVGTSYPGSSSVPALTELSLSTDAWTWTTHIVVKRPLIYQLSSEPRRTEIKLNYWICFACSDSYGKTIKTLWTRLDKKYCLKRLRQNCLISIYQSYFEKSIHPFWLRKSSQALRCFWNVNIF